jgi:nucleotide-binding universal stress UspA family protein
MRKGLTQETRQRAQELLHEFGERVKDKGVEYVEHMKEGVPYEQIVEEMKYHDLFIIGKDPHFFYGHPKQRTQTLAKVVKAIIGPALVVGEEYRSVDRVLVAYDGSPAAARTMRRFVHHRPFGTDMKIDILNIFGSGGATASELLLRQALDYMQPHGFEAQPVSRGGDNPGEEIVAYAREIDADLIVAGAHSVSKVTKMFFGSTTSSLLDDVPVALYVDS